jgi:CubicO group peptidase (beta-lactamase class C family)
MEDEINLFVGPLRRENLDLGFHRDNQGRRGRQPLRALQSLKCLSGGMKSIVPDMMFFDSLLIHKGPESVPVFSVEHRQSHIPL